MQEQDKPNYLKGAAILTAVSIFVKIVGAVYKMPLFQDGVLGDEGTGDFQVTYSIYSLILTISVAGIPAALSRLVSTAKEKGNTILVRRYFSVAMPAFMLIGIAAMLFMFFFADALAAAMRNTMAATGIRVLSPAVFFACVISVYRGYAQGFQNMIPTAISQIVEVLCKAVFGITLALWFVRLGYDTHIVSAGAIVGVTIGLGLCIPLLIRYKRKLDKTLPDSSGQNSSAPVDTDISAKTYKAPGILGQIMKVSIPITISAAFMSLMVVLDNSIVLRRLQDALSMTEPASRAQLGIYSRAVTIYNLVPALLVPVSVSIIPAIAAALAAKRGAEAKSIMQSSLKIINLIAMPAAAGLMILATPILIALYNDSRELTSTILMILGSASLFVCIQYITTSILQANGYEQISLVTFPVGAVVKIAISWILAGNPDFGILASPIGTLACFAVISALNIIFIKIKIKENAPDIIPATAGPLLCSLIMAGITFCIYKITSTYLMNLPGDDRFETILYLALAITAGIGSYAVLVILTRTITMDDMRLLPKGERIGRFLRIKEPRTK